MSRKRNPPEVIWQRYIVDEITGCWNWTGGKDKDGYGRLCIGQKTLSAHRVAYEITYGPIKGIICHQCDNPSCIRPEHLKDGTPQDNINEMVERGRSVFGEKLPQSKLNDAKALEIKKLLKRGNLNQTEIAKMFNVAKSQISAIKHERTWKHIKLEETINYV